MQSRCTEVIIYGASEDEKSDISHILKTNNIELMQPLGSTTYQQERSFLYGVVSKGHQVALIVFGDNALPFGVLSQDILAKKLPVVIYIANDTAKKNYENYRLFLAETNRKMAELYNIDCFCLEKSNFKVVEYHQHNLLSAAIEEVYNVYITQLPEQRKTRQEATQVGAQDLDDTRKFFASKDGLSIQRMSQSYEQFKSAIHLETRPTISYFGPVFIPKTDMCKWSQHLGQFNLIYGLGGADIHDGDKEAQLEKQSTMYQFAHHAAEAGARVFGVIPYSQTNWEKKRDFSALHLEGWYITTDLAERMKAFAQSDLIIVGSCGTGTYEEVLDILRFKPDTPVWIINNDGGTQSLINFLLSCTVKGEKAFNNITAIHNQHDFALAVKHFQQKHQRVIPAYQSDLWAARLNKGNVNPDVNSILMKPN